MSVSPYGIEDESASARTPAAPEVAEVVAPQRPAFVRSKLARTLGYFALIGAIPYLHPKLASLRLFGAQPKTEVAAPEATGIKPEYGELKLAEAQNEKPPILEEQPGEAPLVLAAPSSSAKKPEIPVLSELAKNVGAAYRPVEDPTGHALDGFFASLAKTEAGTPGAITRVAHYGDSLIVSDFMSSTLRRRFQAAYGDAGHGFVLLAKPWAWYFHQDVTHWSSDGWKVHRIVNPRIADELYGYGGATFRTTDGGTRAGFGTAKSIGAADPKNEKEAFGHRVSHFEVSYLEQPEGGGFDLVLDGKKAQSVSTRIPAGSPKKLAVAKLDVEDGEHQLEVKTTGSGEARFFGVVMERNVPGVVWDALGVNGGRARILDVNDDAHWAESLRSRNPALVILQYGTNESEDVGYPQEQYEASLEAVLRQVKVALPESSCLVVGPMDRAGAGSGGMETRPIIYKLNESQRKVAFKVGCAFWDTFLAMGGPGAMGRWVKSTPKLGGGDLTHPTITGANLLGDLLYAALNNAYLERR